jgi:hypothetical protein
MNKAELLQRIEGNVTKIIRDLPSRDLGNGVTEEGVEILITVEGGTQVNDQRFYVVDAGLETESATFMNGREVKNFELQPPTREKKLMFLLNELKKKGTVKGVDLSHLQIPYAELEVAGVKVFVAELAGQLIELQSV